MELEECPKLDSDFSKYIVLNGLPKAKPDKLQKLNEILLKILNEKLGCNVTEQMIDHSFDETGEKTTGTVFLQLKTESEAKITAQQLNDWKLSAKNTISCTTFPEYEKILAEGQIE